jgi:multimeric flavodoxin WrbA/TfoX/Sxy family transcriptional regulator of competence genes
MTEHGWPSDAWPDIYQRVFAADILVLAGPIWLGDNSSVMKRVIEPQYACSDLVNAASQYSLPQHLGYVIPPHADAGWIGEGRPGPSYLDPGSGGPDNDFTNRDTTFMTWNLLHVARMLKDAGGIPAHGNQRSERDAGGRIDFDNPEQEALMEIPKPSEDDKLFFRSLIPDGASIEIKPMFGNLGAFVNGNMFAGLFGPDVGVRLDDAGHDELAMVKGSGLFGPAERPMTGYLTLPAAWRARPDLAASWVERALAHMRSMPPKVKKPKASGKP